MRLDMTFKGLTGLLARRCCRASATKTIYVGLFAESVFIGVAKKKKRIS